MTNQFKQYTTEQLAEKIKEIFVCEEEEEALLDFIQESGRLDEEEINNAKENWGNLEYLAIDEINWLDKEELIDLIERMDIEI